MVDALIQSDLSSDCAETLRQVRANQIGLRRGGPLSRHWSALYSLIIMIITPLTDISILCIYVAYAFFSVCLKNGCSYYWSRWACPVF